MLIAVPPEHDSAQREAKPARNRRAWLILGAGVLLSLLAALTTRFLLFNAPQQVPPPPPSPPASSASSEEVVVVNSRRIDNPFWNIWAEHFAAGPQFQPTSKVLKQEQALVVVDLSLLPFNTEGVESSEISKALEVWLRTTQNPSATLEILLLPDLNAFRLAPNQPVVQTLPVDWGKLREAQSKGSIDIAGDPLTLLRESNGKSPLDLGHIWFRIQANDTTGEKSIGVAVWLNTGVARIPIDEASLSLCIVATTSEECARPDSAAKHADLSFMNGYELAPPDAVLHFVELDAHNAMGIFSCNTCQAAAGQYFIWQLDGGLKDLSEKISRTLIPDIQQAQAVGTEDDWASYRAAGQALFRYLFTSRIDREHAAEAARQFVAFIAAHPEAGKDDSGGPTTPPTLFSRVLPSHEEDFFVIPLNLMFVTPPRGEGGFVGLRVNVDSALLEQSYLSAPSCQRRWVMFVPPPDSDLKLERQEVEGWVRAFTAWQPKAELFDSPLDFDNWILGNKPDGSPVDSEEPPEGAALVVLSHQEGDKLFFNGARKVPAVYSSDVSRYFGQNSIAILSACNAADPRSFDFLKALNAKGVGAIVASPVLLQTPVGGRFLKTLFAQMSKPQTNLQLARFEAIRALFHDPVVGPQALSFTFLGNPSASVCGPKEPAPEE